jgi:hypothetical protein
MPEIAARARARHDVPEQAAIIGQAISGHARTAITGPE